MTFSATEAAFAADVTTVCSSFKVSMPEPLSGVAAMAAKIAGRLSVVTPAIPSSEKSAAVNGGVGVPPAARINRRSITDAIVMSSLWESTAVRADPSTTSFMRPALTEESIEVTPSNAYCEAVSVTSLFEALPSAPASRSLKVLTMTCTSTAESLAAVAAVAITELTAARLVESTPVIPAFK